MSDVTRQPAQPAILPELESLLVRAARRRRAPRFARRRLAVALAGASLLLVAAGAAATGVFELAGGRTASGTFRIETTVVAADGAPRGSICLQLTFSGRGTAYGCGPPPTAAKPFGLLIADPLDNGEERVVYGLVADSISQVAVLGKGGAEATAPTHSQADLPGRFFSVIAPSPGGVEVVAYDAEGREIARLGDVDKGSGRPLSRAEAMQQGDPAGFAPAVPAPERYLYEGTPIEPRTAIRLGLACVQDWSAIRCYDSEAEAESARVRAGRRMR